MTRLKQVLPLLIVFSLALLVRLVYNLDVANGYVAQDDAAWYNQLAYAIAYQHCFCQYPGVASISRPPLWPFMLSIFYQIGPRPAFQQVNASIEVFYGRMLLCFIGSLTCVLVYLLARDLFGKRVGLITGCMAAIYPGLFIYDGWVYTESLYIFLVTAFTYSLYKLQRTGKMRWAMWSGIALGLANLARPNGEVLFGMLAIWATGIILAKGLPWRTLVKGGLAVCLVTTAIIAPWTLRNYQVSHSFVMVSLGGGDVLLGSYNNNVVQGTTGLWTSPRNITPRPDLPPIVLAGHDARGYTAQDDNLATDYALQWILAHPGGALLLMSYHLKTMWTPFTAENNLPFMAFPDRLLSPVIWYLLVSMSPAIFLLAAAGLVLTWRARWRQLLIVYASIALTIAQNVAFYGNMRFRAPIEPLLVLLAGGVLWWFTGDEPGTLHAWRAKKRGRSAIAVGRPSPIYRLLQHP
jgi:4-amino-4-deoxy-L-arabinose transferase-like glycosyltransferase